MSNFKAIYVPLIALVPWVAYPLAWFFLSIKPMGEEWKKQQTARDASRGVYSSATDFTGNWPPEGVDETKLKPRQQAGAEDRKQDAAAFEKAQAARQVQLAAKTKERDEHKKRLEALLSRYMRGIDRKKFDYDRPDEFVYELLFKQREEAGPRLIRALHRSYPNLFFSFDANVPAPNINLHAGNLPSPGPEGRLDWPIGRGTFNLVVYGLYPDLLRFVETFPERYDRILQLTSFSLNREAFDHRGNVLMRLNTSFRMFVFPTNAKPPAPPAPPPGAGAPMEGGSGAEAPPAEGGGGDGGGSGGGEE